MQLDDGLDTGPVYARAAHADRRRRDGGRAARPARRARHPRCSSTRCRAVPTLDARRRRPASPSTRTSSPSRSSASTRPARRRSWRGSCAPATRGPGAWLVVDGRRLKVLACPRSTMPARVQRYAGAPGRVGSTRRGGSRTAAGVLVLDEVQPEGKRGDGRRRVAGAACTATPCVGRPPRERTRERARRDRALVRVEDGAYSNVVVPAGAARERARARATARSSPTSCTARCASSGGSTRSLAPRQPTVRSPSSTRRCAPRCASARTSCSTESPPHAAVGETVDASRRRRARGFVNAVLRRVADAGRRGPSHRDRGDRAARTRTGSSSELAATCGRRRRARGAARRRERPGRADAAAEPATGRPAPDALEAELRRGAASTVAARAPRARRRWSSRGGGDPAALPAVAEGRATPQDQGEPGRRRLPRRRRRASGSSTSPRRPAARRPAIAERVGDGGLVVAADVHAGRLRLVAAPRRRGSGWRHRRARCVADGRRLPGRAGASVRPRCSSTRRAAASACCAAGRRRAGASEPDAVAELAALQRDLLLRRGRGRAPGRACSSTRCAR